MEKSEHITENFYSLSLLEPSSYEFRFSPDNRKRAQIIRISIFDMWLSSGKEEETNATSGNENSNSRVDSYLLSSGLLREYLASAFARNVVRIPSPLSEAASRDFEKLDNQPHHLAEMV